MTNEEKMVKNKNATGSYYLKPRWTGFKWIEEIDLKLMRDTQKLTDQYYLDMNLLRQ